MNLSLLINATGIAAIVVQVAGLTSKSDKVLRFAAVSSACLWALNNYGLGAHSAAALWSITAVRQVSATWVQGRAALIKHASFAVFALIAVGATWATWAGPSTLYSSLATISATAAVFYLSGFWLRLSMTVLPVFWLAHAWHFAAVWQVVANLLVMAAAGYGAWKTRPTRVTLAAEVA